MISPVHFYRILAEKRRQLSYPQEIILALGLVCYTWLLGFGLLIAGHYAYEVTTFFNATTIFWLIRPFAIIAGFIAFIVFGFAFSISTLKGNEVAQVIYMVITLSAWNLPFQVFKTVFLNIFA